MSIAIEHVLYLQIQATLDVIVLQICCFEDSSVVYRSIKTKTNREYRSAVLTATDDPASRQPKKTRKKDGPNSAITRVDVEEALAALSIRMPCQIFTYESGHEIAEYLAMITKAVAEAPYE